MIPLRSGLVARLRLALLCATLAVLGGAPSAQALADTPRPAAVAQVAAVPSRPAAARSASRREARAAGGRVAIAAWPAGLGASRAPALPQRPAARPSYLVFRALLR